MEEGVTGEPEERDEESQDEEWAVLREMPKRCKKKAVAPAETLTAEEWKQRCRKHKTEVLDIICLERYCQRLFCRKCMGNHQNHRHITLADAETVLQRYYTEKEAVIQHKQKLIEEIKKTVPHVQQQMDEIALIVRGLKCGRWSIDFHVEAMGRKGFTVVGNVARVIQKSQSRVEVMERTRNRIAECKKGKDTLKLYVKLKEIISKRDRQYEEMTLDNIRRFIGSLDKVKAMIIADVEEVKKAFGDLEERILLDHFYRIDQELITFSRVLYQCASLKCGKRKQERYVVSKQSDSMKCYDLKDKRMYETTLLNAYTITADSDAYAFTHNHFYVTGGEISASKTIAISYRIDPFRGTYTDIAEMIHGKAYHTMVAVQSSYLYAIGGKRHSGLNSKLCESYSIRQNEWMEIASLPKAKKKPLAFAISDRLIYLLSSTTKKHVYIYDTVDPEEGWARYLISDPFELTKSVSVKLATEFNSNFFCILGTDRSVINVVKMDVCSRTLYRGQPYVGENIQGCNISPHIVFFEGHLYLMSHSSMILMSLKKRTFWSYDKYKTTHIKQS